ncbi:MAG TPA: FAD-dependent oxidoreductase [Oligoflexia bacterium]|nr:FAD-dependent oxidoreductase [Oligoflexia bacterium]HMP49866.1 FAD-dependent oxidoreductase [Oligoflexia bacterium]
MEAVRTAKYDVLVIGAGASGVAAAVAASRRGARTAIIERYGFIGGLACSAEVGTVCGFYARGMTDTGLAGRFPSEFEIQLREYSRTSPLTFAEELSFLPCAPVDFEWVCSSLLREEGVDVFLHTTLFKVEHKQIENAQNQVNSVTCLGWNELVNICFASVVDATGEGLVSFLSGISRIEENSYQAPALVIEVEGIEQEVEVSRANFTERDLNFILLKELADLERGGLGFSREYEKFFGKGIFCDAGILPRLSVVPGSFSGRSAKLKMAYPFRRNSDSGQMTRLELYGRSMAHFLVSLLKENVPLFSGIKLCRIAAEVGVRTGPKNSGKDILLDDDLLQAKKPVDGIANGLWPIEIWDEGRRPVLEYFPPKTCYQIPVGALISSQFSNLFFCGRGISATERALSSARVIGTCLGTGYAAGVLAADFCLGIDTEASVKWIRENELN